MYMLYKLTVDGYVFVTVFYTVTGVVEPLI